MLEVEGVIADHEIVAGGRDFLVQTWVGSTLRTVVQGGIFERRVGVLGELRNIAAEHRGKALKMPTANQAAGRGIYTYTDTKPCKSVYEIKYDDNQSALQCCAMRTRSFAI